MTYFAYVALAQCEGDFYLHAGETRFARLAPDVLSAQAPFQVDDADHVVVRISALVQELGTWIVGPAGQVVDEQTIIGYGGNFASFTGSDAGAGLFALPCDEPGVHRVYRFPSLGAGTYTVHVQVASPPPEDTAVLIELSSDSVTGAALLVTQSVLTLGTPAVLVAVIFDGTTPVSGASVQAWVRPPVGETVLTTLVDDGAGIDAAAGDGLYSGTFGADEVGDYAAVAEIAGATSGGTPFSRMATTSVKVVPVHATFTGTFTDAGVDTNGNGLFERVRLSAQVNVVTAGRYIFLARLRSGPPPGNEADAIMTGYGTADLGVGNGTVSSHFEAPAFLAANLDTAWYLAEAELVYVGLDGAEPAATIVNANYGTQVYHVSQFEHPPIRLTGQNNDRGVDTDGDTRFDLLRVRVGVQADTSGSYCWAARLVDRCGGHFQFVSGEQELLAGVPTQLVLEFNGRTIGRRGIDGPYELVDFAVYGPGGALNESHPLSTAPYSAQLFEEYQPFVDCNGNGIPDACDLLPGQPIQSADCDFSGVPDECQHSPGTTNDRVCWQSASSSGPAARYYHALAYDGQRSVAVLFGGFGAGYYADTWEWDGGTWHDRAVSGPSSRRSHAMAYDAARHETILFGGERSGGALSYETWKWNGTGWALAATTGPTRPLAPAMSYDAARQVIVLFGGQQSYQNVSRETWEWNGNAWSLRSQTGPGPRAWAAMAYDTQRHVTVLFGGNYNGTMLGDTWEWDGSTWTDRTSAGPSARYGHAMAYEGLRGAALMFGGTDATGQKADCWAWNGTAWTQLAGTAPPARMGHAMAYDSQAARSVLFGGWALSVPDGVYFGDTWKCGPGLRIVQEPTDITVSVGAAAQFAVQIDWCAGNATYQWWQDDHTICDNDRRTGVHANTLNISPVRFSDAGDYRVTVYAGDSYVTTVPVTLTVRGGGDMDCNGSLDFDDINPFVFAVSDPAGYEATFPNCNLLNGDINGDGLVDFDDINLFVALLSG
jgi:hypothetical protein